MRDIPIFCVYSMSSKPKTPTDSTIELASFSNSTKDDNVPCDFDLDLTHEHFNMCKKCGKHRKEHKNTTKTTKNNESTKVSDDDLSRPAIILRAASNSRERKQREEEEAANRLYKFLENEITKKNSIFHDGANVLGLLQFMKDNYNVKSARDVAVRISTENLKRDLLRKNVSKEQILWFRYSAYRFEARHLNRMEECPICYDDDSNIVILFCDANGEDKLPSKHVQGCVNCLKKNIQMSGIAATSCTSYQCSTNSEFMLRNILQGKDLSVLNEAKTNEFFGTLGQIMIKCPGVDCEARFMARTPGEIEKVNCTQCGTQFCSLCKKDFHFHGTSCEEMLRLREAWSRWLSGGKERFDFYLQLGKDVATANQQSKKEAEKARAALIEDERYFEKNAKRCPHCKRAVEFLEGCNLMICGRDYHGGNIQSGCGKKFLWKKPTQGDDSRPVALPCVVFERLVREYYSLNRI